MGTGRTDGFRKDAVRIALTSGLTRKQISDDPLAGRRLPSIAVRLGVGMSTLNKWITAHRERDVVSQEDREFALEDERLRRENRILREERDILKKASVGSIGQRSGLIKGISGRLKAKRFSRPRIEPQGNLVEVALRVDG